MSSCREFVESHKQLKFIGLFRTGISTSDLTDELSSLADHQRNITVRSILVVVIVIAIGECPGE